MSTIHIAADNSSLQDLEAQLYAQCAKVYAARREAGRSKGAQHALAVREASSKLAFNVRKPTEYGVGYAEGFVTTLLGR
jgi:hypothetical protein